MLQLEDVYAGNSPNRSHTVGNWVKKETEGLESVRCWIVAEGK